jgi:ribosome-binding protein aMBF1 (putative translation factor)
MSVEELGRKMNLRVQDLQKYEGGSVPPDSIAKKLERELGIVILEEAEANDVSPVVKRSNKSVTITDMLDDLMRDASND